MYYRDDRRRHQHAQCVETQNRLRTIKKKNNIIIPCILYVVQEINNIL